MTHMSILNTVDYIAIVLLILGGIKGAMKGFLEELAQKFGLVLGLIASLMFTQSAVPFVMDNLTVPLWVATGLSYVVIFILGYLLMKIIGSVLQAIFKNSNLSFIDNLLGFLLGVFEVVLLIGVIIMLIQHQSLINFDQYIDASYLCSNYINPFFNWIAGLVQKAF